MYETVDRIVDQIEWTEPLGEALQNGAKFVNRAAAPASFRVRNVLGGTWLGHPVHPAITDITVGARTVASILDVTSAFSSQAGLDRAADIAIGTGMAAALTSGVTGFNDWSTTHGKDRKVGLIHGLLMISSTSVYALSMTARRGGYRKTGVLSALVGIGILLAGSYLGGDEVFDLGYGVNHTAFEHPPQEFTPVMKESDLKEREPIRVEANGVPIMLVRINGRIYGLGDTCVHAGCSLSEGKVDESTVTCQCHGSRYRLKDGGLVQGPATRSEPSFEVRTHDGMIEVRSKAA